MRYLLHESDHPISTDYYYECRKTTNDHFPRVLAHTHDYYEIYIYLSGSVMLFIEDRIYKVKRGDIIVKLFLPIQFISFFLLQKNS